jgi:hypothetical protein
VIEIAAVDNFVLAPRFVAATQQQLAAGMGWTASEQTLGLLGKDLKPSESLGFDCDCFAEEVALFG